MDEQLTIYVCPICRIVARTEREPGPEILNEKPEFCARCKQENMHLDWLKSLFSVTGPPFQPCDCAYCLGGQAF